MTVKETLFTLRQRFAITVLLVAVTLLPAQAQSFHVLYTFEAGLSVPYSGVTVDNAGNLYGTTGFSYAGWGGVYKLSNKNGVWVFSLLFSFNGGNGNTPLAPPVFGPDGSLYGTTSLGGFGCDLGCGNIYNLRSPISICKTARCYWTLSTAYDFGATTGDGAYPMFGNLLFDDEGNIFGTTSSNDIGSNSLGGTVFKISRSGGTWTETILHQFGYGNDGSYPASGLIRDGEGNLYGTTVNGGSSSGCDGDCGFGTVYELSPTGSGWVERVLYSFQGQSDGGDPVGGLVMDASGNLYGTTSSNGVNSAGTVFELTHSNGAWTLNTLYSFTQSGQSQAYCYGQVGSLLLDSAGNLYGTTCTGGALGYGAVFKLTHSNGAWTYSSLHDFTNGSDGANPVGNPAFDRNGNIFGTASRGGGQQLVGTVWEVTP